MLKQYLHTPMVSLDITEKLIIEAVNSISSFSAAGPDGIPAQFYKDYASALSLPIKIIWEASLKTGKLPEGFALATVKPFDKGGEKSDPSNFRPIALTNRLTKIFERILHSVLVSFLDKNNLFNSSQHGFRKYCSTITQLISYFESIITSLEEGNLVDAIYLDFAKAFDKVDHNISFTNSRDLTYNRVYADWKVRENHIKIT